MFEHVRFIKPATAFEPAFSDTCPTPLFRRVFYAPKVAKAILRLCALGVGYARINGKEVSEDLFVSPVSDYNKTLWVCEYDVTSLLSEGQNALTVQCGNGFFNEAEGTSWDFNKAVWRDLPKVALELVADGKQLVTTDAEWKCKPNTAITFQQLRLGEHYDARLEEDEAYAAFYDDGAWQDVILDQTPPTGKFLLCPSEPIRATGCYRSVSVRKNAVGNWLFDIGQNISGVGRVRVSLPEGTLLTVRYGEMITPDGQLDNNIMAGHYKAGEFMTERIVCGEGVTTHEARFAYYGFRYAELSGWPDGAPDPTCDVFTGVFVHQTVASGAEFKSSDDTLNALYRIGKMAQYCNMFHMLTDCPTREKLGWANDAQSSMAAFTANHRMEKFLTKWFIDICDAMRSDGAMPGIIPTSGWGFDWGNGPVSDGILFELPYRVWLNTGDAGLLYYGLPYFQRYLAYLDTRKNGDGTIDFGLEDWTPPEKEYADTPPVQLINMALEYKFRSILQRTLTLAKDKTPCVYAPEMCVDGSVYPLLLSAADKAFAEADAAYDRAERALDALKKRYMSMWIGEDGRCVSNCQSAAAMTISLGLYDELEPLKEQLIQRIEYRAFHHECGMAGMPHLFNALHRCGLDQIAYRILTQKDYPSYGEWLTFDATTLWESWGFDSSSHNHHMFSCFMDWMIYALGGVGPCESAPGFDEAVINPFLPDGVDFIRVKRYTRHGWITVKTARDENGKTTVETELPKAVRAR